MLLISPDASRNIAASVGATGKTVDQIADQLVAERKIRMDRAKEIFDELSKRA